MKIIILDEVDSTNEYLKKEYAHLPVHTCLRAIRQTAGKGRRDHIWNSQTDNLTVSFLYRDITDIQEAWKYTMIAARSIMAMLTSYGIDAKIKWPNDIYVGHQKICGILTETILEPDLQGIVIGIGINVNDARPYLSMKELLHVQIDVSDVMARLIAFMVKYMEQYRLGNFSKILNELNEQAFLLGKWIQYQDYGTITFLGINDQGMAEYINQNGEKNTMVINEITLS